MSGLTISRSIAWLAVLAALALVLWPAAVGGPPGAMRAAGVVTLTIGLLATAAVPEYLTALLFFFLSVVLAVAPPEVVFSGFYSGAVWLVFGGLILGVAIDDTGLGARIARLLVRLFAGSYFAVIAGTVLVMALLAFVMPSSVGRVTIMLPIVLALADRLGFSAGRPGRTGLAVAVGLGTLVPTFAVLPASVPNLALAGAAEAIYGVHLAYSSYLVLHFPVIGAVSVLVLPILIVVLFPDVTAPGAAESAPVPLTAREIRLMAVLVAALGFWVTDSLHGIAPAWVALGAGILCVLPGVGVMSSRAMVGKLNFAPILFLAGVIGMGAVVTESGLGRVLGDVLMSALPLQAGGGPGTFAAVVGLGVAMGVVTTLPGQPAIMTALADGLAQATGWPLLSVLMAQVPSWALLMFPYQAPPLIVTMAIGGVRVGQMLRIMLPLALFGWLVMMPLQYLWWRTLGYLP